MQPKWSESISRRIVQALSSSFRSVNHAVEEIADNAIDHMMGQATIIDIEFDKDANRIVIESDGGRGMGVDEIASWLNWGESDSTDSSIGFYGQGGKAACAYLGDHVQMWAKMAHSNDIWFIEDKGWRTRTDFRQWDDPVPIDRKGAPLSVGMSLPERGHVRIEISDCVPNRQWRIDSLRKELSATYDHLLRGGDLRIIVNGAEVLPNDLPFDTKLGKTPIDVVLPSGVSATGWVARLERQRLGDDTVRSGFKLFAKGRMMVDQEWFGYNWTGKGSLNQLYGELVVKGLTPNLNKSGFIEQDDDDYRELGKAVLAQAAPLISKLRKLGHSHKVSAKDRKTAQQVHAELQRVVNEIIDKGSGEQGKARKEGATGRKERDANSKTKGSKGQSTGRRNSPASEPPDDAVGKLKRLLRGRDGQYFPEIRVESWSADQRTATRDEGERKVILVNKSYPIYLMMESSKAYVAESAIMEFLLQQGDVKDAAGFAERLGFLIGKWAELAAPDLAA